MSRQNNLAEKDRGQRKLKRKTSWLGWLQRILCSWLGLIICGIGVSFFMRAHLGVDTASVFQLGLSHQLHLSYGHAAALMHCGILLIIFLVDRSYIHLSSLFAIFGIGYTADAAKQVLEWILPQMDAMWVRLLFVLIGLFLMSVGVITYIHAGLGVGAIDLVSEILSDKLHYRYDVVRIVGDALYVVLGYLMGGSVGVGTVFSALLLGPLVHWMRPSVHALLDASVLRNVCTS